MSKDFTLNVGIFRPLVKLAPDPPSFDNLAQIDISLVNLKHLEF